MSAIIVTVGFGNPPAGGGPCTGKGLCQVSHAGNDAATAASNVTPTSTAAMPASATTGIPVTFEVSPLDKSVLVMSFRMSDLEKSQPDQVAFFRSGEYIFDDLCPLTHPELRTLNFHHNPRIEKGKKNTVHIVGDLVTTFFHYSHD